MSNASGEAPRNRIVDILFRMEAARLKAAELAETDDRWTVEARLSRVERNAIELNGLISDLATELSAYVLTQAEAQKAQLQLIADMAMALQILAVQLGDPSE